MLTKQSLESLAQIRLDDAVCLLRYRRSSAAYYISGYAVELGLKAVIAKLMHADTIPDKAFINAVYVHQLNSLVSTAGLKIALDAGIKADSVFAGNWAVVSNWNEQSRYEVWDQIAATTMLSAVIDPSHGVFQWVKRHW